MLLLIVLLFTFFIIFSIIVLKRKNDDLFSPLILGYCIHIITTIPYLVSLSRNYNLLAPQLRIRITEYQLPVAIIQYLILFVLGLFMMGLGTKSTSTKRISESIPILVNQESKGRYYLASTFFILLGLMSYIVFFQEAGGFNNWLNNIHLRASFTSGRGYLTLLMGLLEIGVYAYICTFKYKNTLLKRGVLSVSIVGVALLTSTLGGRKSTLFFVIYCIIVWTFVVGKIKRIGLKSLIIIPLFVIYILAVPILRTPEGINYYTQNPSYLVEEITDNLELVSKQFSYVDHHLLIMEEFDVDDIWLGRSYLDLLYAPIPSSIFEDKPPVDDGVYVRSIADGIEVTPPTPYNQLYQSSWPPETFGAMYMNFHWPGVLIGMYLLGIVYGTSFQYMKKSGYSLFSILIYANIITNFHFSNLRIVQTFSNILLILMFFIIFFSKRIKR